MRQKHRRVGVCGPVVENIHGLLNQLHCVPKSIPPGTAEQMRQKHRRVGLRGVCCRKRKVCSTIHCAVPSRAPTSTLPGTDQIRQRHQRVGSCVRVSCRKHAKFAQSIALSQINPTKHRTNAAKTSARRGRLRACCRKRNTVCSINCTVSPNPAKHFRNGTTTRRAAACSTVWEQ